MVKEEKKGRGRPAKEKEQVIIPEGLPIGKVTDVNIKEIDSDTTFEFRVAYKVSDLVKSIREEGLQFPVILRGDKPYQLISGFRRLRACKELGMPKIKAIIREDLSDEEAHRLSWLENEVKKSLTPLDKAHAIEKLKSQGKKTEDISTIFGISVRQVQRLQQIIEYPDILKKALKDDDINFKHAILLMQAHKKNSKLDLKSWIEAINKEALSAEELKKMLRKETKKIKKQMKLMEKRARGFRFYPFAFNPDSTSEIEKKEMIGALRSALQFLERT